MQKQDDSASKSEEGESQEQWLVTFLGLNHTEMSYLLRERSVSSKYAGAALIDLLGDDAPQNVVVLATPQSKESVWPDAEAAFSHPARRVECRELQDVDDLSGFLDELVSAVPKDKRIGLSLDLTHGFRHLPVLAYAGLLYLEALRPCLEVKGCWSALVEDGKARFLDLLPLVKLPPWLYSLRLLEDRADATMLARLVKEATEALQFDEKPSEHLEDFATALSWRCPLDVAAAAHKVVPDKKPLGRLLRSATVPGAHELRDRLFGVIEDYSLPREEIEDDSLPKGKGEKPAIDQKALAMHARHVDHAFERSDLPGAASLLREWTVSWAWWMTEGSKDPEKNGLHRSGEREPAEGRLNALRAYVNDKDLNGKDLKPLLSEDQVRLGKLWHSIGVVRNALMHNGMRPGSVLELKSCVQTLREEWEWLQRRPQVQLQPAGRRGTLLVTPLGRSLGVLPAALDRCDPRPDQLLVLTSEEGQREVGELVGDRLPDDAVTVLVLKDPFAGTSEVDAIVKKAKLLVAGFERVRVNLTGGTTLLGLVVERIARQAEGLVVPVRRFVLLERKQEDGSFHSELAWVDQEEGEAKASDGADE